MKHCKLAWNNIFNFSEEEWEKNYKRPFERTNNTTLQWFQPRINHIMLATNKYLHKIKLINNLHVHTVLKNLNLLNICCGTVSTHESICMVLNTGVKIMT